MGCAISWQPSCCHRGSSQWGGLPRAERLAKAGGPQASARARAARAVLWKEAQRAPLLISSPALLLAFLLLQVCPCFPLTSCPGVGRARSELARFCLRSPLPLPLQQRPSPGSILCRGMCLPSSLSSSGAAVQCTQVHLAPIMLCASAAPGGSLSCF